MTLEETLILNCDNPVRKDFEGLPTLQKDILNFIRARRLGYLTASHEIALERIEETIDLLSQALCDGDIDRIKQDIENAISKLNFCRIK